MAWALRLVKIGAEGEESCKDAKEINLSLDLGDLANLGLTLSNAKLLLASLQREIIASQPTDDAVQLPNTPQPPTSRRPRAQPRLRAISKKPASPPYPEEDEDPVWGDLLGWMRLPAPDPSPAAETPASAPPPNRMPKPKVKKPARKPKK